MPTPDPRGPVVTPGIRPVLRPGGFEVPGFDGRPPDLPPPTAGWIGADTPSPLFVLRRAFPLQSVPRTAPCLLSADRSYRLWVNGRLASRGPDDIGMDYHRVQNDRWLVDARDLAPYLVRGRNVVAVEVFADPLIGWEGSRGRGGFLFELRAGDVVVRSDPSWKARPARHWSRERGHWEFDPADPAAAAHDPAFDDSAWSPAVALPDRWQPRVLSEIPPRAEIVWPPVAATAFPLDLRAGDGRVAVRFGRVIPAYLGVDVEGGAGGTLWIEPNEPDAPGYHRRFAVRLTGGRTVVEAPYMDSFSVVNLRVEGTAAPVRVHGLRACAVSQPVAYRGAFASSDPALNRLWEVCRWATQICLQTHHLDSPHHQEPISDPGDYWIASLVNYGAFLQPALTRQDARKYAGILRACRNQVFHTSYALLWLRMVVDCWDYTGDESLPRELAPEIFSVLDTFAGYRGRNGLISEAPNYMFLDWVDIAGFPGHHPPAVIGQGYLSAMFHRALDDGARVARLVGDTARARRCDTLRAALADAFERELWVPERGLYRDGKPFQTSVPPGQWLPADREIETFTAHVNILAVWSGIAPRHRWASVLAKALDGPDYTCQPYFLHFVFDALEAAGLFEARAMGQLRRWKVVEETGSLREMWTTGDLSHSWGATPLHQCMTRILGVRPSAPGFARAEIAPTPCGLAWARGKVPTPHGPIAVSWRRDADGAFRLETTIPRGVQAQVRLPGASESVPAGPGRHRYTRRIP